MTGLTRRKIELPVAALVAVLVVVLAGGLWAGNTSALGAKRMHEATGVAMLHNQDNWLTSFDAEDGSEQHVFHGDQIWWESGSETGESRVPCLRVGKQVPVRIGWTWVAGPNGGRHQVVSWVECLNR